VQTLGVGAAILDGMTFFIATSTAAVVSGFVVEWAQRRCELWAQLRDKDL
jgi:hypothetical protein